MQFGFHIVSKQQFDVYRELALADPYAADELRLAEWEVPKTRRADWSCSLALCITEDYVGYRGELPDSCRDALGEYLKRTVFCCRNDGIQTSDLPTQGFEICGAFAAERAARLASIYRAIDVEQVRRSYRSERGIEYELFIHVLESWAQLLEAVGPSGRYLIVMAG